jgi:hypothetical protein
MVDFYFATVLDLLRQEFQFGDLEDCHTIFRRDLKNSFTKFRNLIFPLKDPISLNLTLKEPNLLLPLLKRPRPQQQLLLLDRHRPTFKALPASSNRIRHPNSDAQSDLLVGSLLQLLLLGVGGGELGGGERPFDEFLGYCLLSGGLG